MDRYVPPIQPPRPGVDYPENVRVMNLPDYGKNFLNTIRNQYELLRGQAKENQVAVLRYHSPAGQVIRVTQVSLYRGSNTLILYGDDGNNPCIVLTQAQSAQLILKIIPTSEAPEPERRKPIGFTVEDPGPENEPGG
jgi:hypothetical protein